MDVEDQAHEALRQAEASRNRRLKMGLLLAGLGTMVVTIATVVLVVKNGLDPLLPAGALAVGAVILAVGGAIMGKAWPGAATAAIQRGLSRRDRDQRARRQSFFLMSNVLLLVMLPQTVAATDRLLAGEPRPLDYVFIGGLMVLSCVTPTIVAGHGWGAETKHLEDELTDAIRARAFRVGYAVQFVGVLVLMGVGLYRPTWAVVGLPVLLALGAAAPALWFAILDRRADPSSV